MRGEGLTTTADLDLSLMEGEARAVTMLAATETRLTRTKGSAGLWGGVRKCCTVGGSATVMGTTFLQTRAAQAFTQGGVDIWSRCLFVAGQVAACH